MTQGLLPRPRGSGRSEEEKSMGPTNGPWWEMVLQEDGANTIAASSFHSATVQVTWVSAICRLDCSPRASEMSCSWANLKASLSTPKCLPFICEDGTSMTELCVGCSAEPAGSWPRAMECEKVSNFKTALGQFNKLLPPPSSPQF